MYRMGIISLVLDNSKDKFNRDKLIKLCLVHDLAEAVIGDILPTEYSNISREEKHKMELKAFKDICKDIFDNSETGTEIINL